jgi:hypothetical protein
MGIGYIFGNLVWFTKKNLATLGWRTELSHLLKKNLAAIIFVPRTVGKSRMETLEDFFGKQCFANKHVHAF